MSGVPITKCVEDAIERWLATAAAARFLYLKRLDEEQARAKAKTPATLRKAIAEMEPDIKKTKPATKRAK